MIIKEVTFHSADGSSIFEALIQRRTPTLKGFTVRIVIHKEIESPASLGDPFLAACLVPCMFLNESLEVEAPVSSQLLAGINHIQGIFRNWYPKTLNRIQVITTKITTVDVAQKQPLKSACFFSGGVDSWYSVLNPHNEIGALVTVKGFDIPYADVSIWTELAQSNRQIANELGKELILVETNLRQFLDPTQANLGKTATDDFWGKYLHGAFLAAVGLCLQQHFSNVIVPSSYPYAQLHPWATHPLVDPLWSTGQTHFSHDGCEVNRIEKLTLVAKSKTALRNLRVCFSYSLGRYNCCQCEKCFRTMLALYLLGVLDQASSFDRPLNLRMLETMRLSPGSEVWYEDMLDEARFRQNHEVIDILRVILGQKFSARRKLSGLKACLKSACRRTASAAQI
jgi:hypothetical protein